MGQRAPKPQTLLPGGPRWMQICGLWRSLPGVGLCYLSRGRTGQDMTKRYSSCCSLQGLEHFLRSLDICVLHYPRYDLRRHFRLFHGDCAGNPVSFPFGGSHDHLLGCDFCSQSFLPPALLFEKIMHVRQTLWSPRSVSISPLLLIRPSFHWPHVARMAAKAALFPGPSLLRGSSDMRLQQSCSFARSGRGILPA